MMKIFGSDGFRSRFGEKYMTCDFLSAFANAIADFYFRKETSLPILIGRDSRTSGRLIENLLVSVLNYRGVDVVITGILPTPVISSILGDGRHALGIMITASHNPAADNGIKLFESTGFKLEESYEKLIERDIVAHLNKSICRNEGRLGFEIRSREIEKAYIHKLKKRFPRKGFKGRILVDCSNGAFSELAKNVLQDCSEIDFTNNKPNGENINLDCGALEPDRLLDLVKTGNYDFGAAFDGDGDRAVFVSKEYGVIESEKLIVLFAKLLRGNGARDVIVSTEICNKGLEKNLEDLGLTLIQTEVGDRHVVENTFRHNALLGAEPSGHYIFPKEAKSMDGLMAVFHFMELLSFYQGYFYDVLRELKHFHRIKKNIPVSDVVTFELGHLNQKMNALIDHNKEKIVIRRSIWDPVLRIYYDYEDKNNFAVAEPFIHKFLTEIGR